MGARPTAATDSPPESIRTGLNRMCPTTSPPRSALPARGVAREPTGFFTDVTLCIGCKACEVACKEWNQVPDDGFAWSGLSYDHTRALGPSTWRHVKFVEQKLPLAILLWNNDGLGQIRDDMIERKMPEIGVTPEENPDYQMLATAFGCQAVRPGSLREVADALRAALSADRPTLIEVRQDAAFL